MSVGHVAGPVASQALDALVGQFADRTSFIRELVQNSLDAGAGRVDVAFRTDEGPLVIEVVDDGEGMDLAIIEGCLLTLFRSSKERDLTKIGKFGVGFVSLFALDPVQVVVDTGRDGLHYRVAFAADRSYTLMEVDDPFEGTAVRIETRETGAAARKLAEATHKALHYWCRFARADITSECTGAEWGWDYTEVTGAFTIDAPVVIEVDEPGFRAVLGPSSGGEKVAFHNRGLTLLESREALVPGVSFRVEAATLEHTLTRDNVLRDGHFHDVIRRLEELARGPLWKRWCAALTAAVACGDHEQRRALIACTHPHALPLPRDTPLFPTVHGPALSLEELQPKGVVAKARAKLGKVPVRWCAPEPTPLTQAAHEAGIAVLWGAEDAADLEVAAALASFALEPLASTHKVAIPVEPQSALLHQATQLHRGMGQPPLVGAHLHPPTPRLAVVQSTPGELRQGAWSDGSGVVVINLDHPLLDALAALPDAVAAPILSRAALAEVRLRPVPEATVDALSAAIQAHIHAEGAS